MSTHLVHSFVSVYQVTQVMCYHVRSHMQDHSQYGLHSVIFFVFVGCCFFKGESKTLLNTLEGNLTMGTPPETCILPGPSCILLQEEELIQAFFGLCEQWACGKQFLCRVVSGKRCVFSINECASNPCKNGAQCLDYVNEFTCLCPPGWTGKTCDVDINECSSNPCKNKGQCVTELNGYRCKCKPAFSGTNCEINIEDCANPNPCQNGATCSDGLMPLILALVPVASVVNIVRQT